MTEDAQEGLNLFEPCALDGRQYPGHDRAWAEAAAKEAVGMFPNQGLRPLAQALAASHPRALDYLRQAPVLAVGASFGKVQLDSEALRLCARIFAIRCEAKMRLPAVMRSFALPPAARVLNSKILAPGYWLGLRAIQHVNPSALAQAIPGQSGRQRTWLRAINTYVRELSIRRGVHLTGRGRIEWAATRLATIGPAEIRTVRSFCDFLTAPDEVFDERWSWAQARAAEDRWHEKLGRRIDPESFKRAHGVDPHHEFPTEPFPLSDRADPDYDFWALRTGLAMQIEGKAMHNCLASYSRFLSHGSRRYFSIRAKDGARVASLEVAAAPAWRPMQIEAHCGKPPPKAVAVAALAFVRRHTPERPALHRP